MGATLGRDLELITQSFLGHHIEWWEWGGGGLNDRIEV